MERDWDDAYANMPHIPGGADYPARWAQAAASFRKGARAELDLPYGPAPRHAFDLFRPAGPPKGLFVFVHGGYWMAFGKGDWSHLAAGAVARGYAACLVGYELAPQATISEITSQICTAITAAAQVVDGPIYLSGHSAGGDLVLRQLCEDSALDASVLARVARVTGISGVYDLRPLRKTKLNDTLRLTAEEANAESPVLQAPATDVPVTLWVGAEERPEFIRQNRAMALMWEGLGADVTAVEEEGTHHFSVVEGLEDAASPLMSAVFAG